MTGEIDLLRKTKEHLKAFNLQTFCLLRAIQWVFFLKEKTNKKPPSSGCFLYDYFFYSDFSLCGMSPYVVFTKC